MVCTHCKYQNSAGAVYCAGCGRKLRGGDHNKWILYIAVGCLVAIIIIACIKLLGPPDDDPPVGETTAPPNTSTPISQMHTHSWIDATCTTPKTCYTCGEVSGSELGHRWMDATYDAPKTCSVCGATSGEVKKKSNPFAYLRVGDTVYFGSFEQDNNKENGKESIEWVVLDIDNGRAFLMSRYGLDCRMYHDTEASVTWEDCSLREWLNASFLNSAFYADEKELILTTLVSADANPDYNTRTGNATYDKIYLLSTVEAKSYYPDYRDRVCTPTDYAVAQGAFLNKATNGGWWWLRTPGDGKKTAASVDSNGSDDSDGSAVNAQKGMVRPVMWVTTE